MSMMVQAYNSKYLGLRNKDNEASQGYKGIEELQYLEIPKRTGQNKKVTRQYQPQCNHRGKHTRSKYHTSYPC